MHVGHHSASAAAANSFEEREWRFHNLSKLLNRVTLVGPQRQTCGSRNNKDAPACFSLNLKDVSCVAVELLEINRDDLAAGRLQTVEDALAFARLGDRIGAEHGESITNAHCDIGVQDGVSVLLNGSERDRLVTQVVAQLSQ